MFKILLISPPVFDFYFTPARGEALGLLYLKSIFSDNTDIKVDIYDSRVSRKIKKRAFPPHFEYLKKYYIKDESYFSLFSSYYRFGDSFAKIVNKIKEGDYDLIGISSLFSGYHNNVEKLIARIKEELDTPIVLGGWAIDAEKERLFKDSLADFFIFGVAEEGFYNLVQNLKEKKLNTKNEKSIEKFNKKQKKRKKAVKNSIFIDNGVVSTEKKYTDNSVERVKNDFFEEIPIREHKYYFRKKRIAKVTISKGCKFSCSFCAIHKNQNFRVRSFKSIIKELEYLLSIGVEIVDFEDDNLFFQKEWSIKFLKILKEFHKKGLSYSAMNGITAINLLPFTQDALDVGFIEFNLSLVSSNTLTAKNLKRAVFKSPIEKIASITNGKIEIIVFLIAGLPENNPQMLLDDILYLANLPVKIGISPLYLVPDIDMFEKMNLPQNRDLLRGSALYKFGENFSREDVVSIWKYVRMINALKLSPLDETLKENLLYFKKSINEKIWYYKSNEEWLTSFSFELELPKKIKINNNNEIIEYDFSFNEVK